jgi:hypothetical protein
LGWRRALRLADRSAAIVAAWLTAQRAAAPLVDDVAELVRRYEIGGGRAAA